MKLPTENKFFKNLIILLFMLFSVDIFGMGWYIFGGAVGLLIIYMLMVDKKLTLSPLFAWVTLLALTNFLILNYHSNADIVTKVIKYLLSPIGAFVLGTQLAKDEEEANGIMKLYMIAVIPYLIHGILNISIFNGFDEYERMVTDYWTGQKWNATLACTYFAMTVPLCFNAFICKGFLKKILYLGATAVSIYASFITASRTVVIIGLLVILMEFWLYIKEKADFAKKIKNVALFLIVVMIVAGVVIGNMENLSTTNFFGRMTNNDMSEEPRIQLFMNIIENCWAYPFGNMPYFYSHNTWLDFLRESGWITFICFMAITIICVRHIVSIFKNKHISQEYRLAVVGMMTALLLDMFVEPMMDGAAILFCLFFYFIGVNSVYAEKKELTEEKQDV